MDAGSGESRRKLRIVHIISGLGAGGAETTLFRLLKHLGQDRYESTVVQMLSNGRVKPKIEALGIPVLDCSMSRQIPSPMMIWRLRKMVRELQPDLLHGWMYHGNLSATLCSAFLPTRAAALWSIRSAMHAAVGNKLRTTWVIWLSALLSWQPVKILYNSHTSLEQHCRIGFRRNTSLVIPNGFDCEIFRPVPEARTEMRRKLGLNESEIVVGMVARCHPVKGHPTLVQAAARLEGEFPGARFLLVGRDLGHPTHGVCGMLRELGLEKKFILLDECDEDTLVHLYNAMDVAVLSSNSESFPNVVGEAMACGIPAVATDVGDARFLVGETGVLVPPADPSLLASGLARLISMPREQREELGRAARARIQARFSLGALVQRYAELYNTLICRPEEEALRPVPQCVE